MAELERTVAKLSAEITLRCTQVADLHNIKQQQESELLNACEEIELLIKSIDLLQFAITKYDEDAAIEKQKLAQFEAENSDLRLQLETVQKEFENADQQHLNQLNLVRDQYEEQIRMIEAAVAERDKQVETLEEARASLASHCDDLTKIVNAFELNKRTRGKSMLLTLLRHSKPLLR